MQFKSEKEAINYLEKITNSKVSISDKKQSSLPKENINKLLFYFQEALGKSKDIPAYLAYGIGFFQKHPELINSISMEDCILAENLAKQLYELLNDITAKIEDKNTQTHF